MIRDFIKELGGNYPGIRKIWLLGSRANNDAIRPDSDWDFIAFANESTHSLIQNDTNLQKKTLDLSIDLLVEKERGALRSVWGTSKSLRLKEDLRWTIISDTTAKYWAAKLVEKESTEQPWGISGKNISRNMKQILRQRMSPPGNMRLRFGQINMIMVLFLTSGVGKRPTHFLQGF